MAGAGGGAWKVAYADFVTAMMAFFLVMWLVGQKDGAKQAIAEYFNDPWATSRISTNRSRDPSVIERRSGDTYPKKKSVGSNPRSVPHDDPEAPERKTPRLVTVREPERTATGAVIPFASGSAQLPADARERLEALLPSIAGLQHKIDVRGHVAKDFAFSDTSPEEAWQLCFQRSVAVKHLLQELGITPDRIRLSQAASHEPMTLVTDGEEMESNGRVEVFMTSETVDNFQGTRKQREATQIFEDNKVQTDTHVSKADKPKTERNAAH